MLRPNPEEAEQWRILFKNYPKAMNHLKRWRQFELEALPMATSNTAQLQGRCQILKELLEVLDPDTFGKANSSR